MSAGSAESKALAVLSGLERRGGGVLVVGDHVGQRRLCERLLGGPERERVVVARGDSNPTGRCRHDATVVRSGAATPSRAGPALQSSSLVERVTETIEARGRDLDPAELRVCLGSVDPTRLGARRVFLDAVLGELRRVNALGHVHVPEPHDGDLVRRLEPLVDATVEVRVDPRPEQRWILPEHGVTTDWLDLG